MVDQTPSSVTSTPRTPRLDLASRLAAKNKKEKEQEKGADGFLQRIIWVVSASSLSSLFSVFPAQRKKSSVVSLDPEGLNVEVGDQVLVAGQKHGIVRFYGKTEFAPGLSSGHQPKRAC